MRALAVIPARMASTRFPGKPLADFAGEPMVARVHRRVRECGLLAQVLVAGCDPEVQRACEERRIPFVPTSNWCRSGTERCQQALRQIAQRDPDEVVVDVQGDEPLIRPGDVELLVRQFEDPEVRIASLCRPFFPGDVGTGRNLVKVLVGRDWNAVAFTRDVGFSCFWRIYMAHVGAYAFRRPTLAEAVDLAPVGDLEQIAWMRAGIPVRMAEIDHRTLGVDSPEDLRRALEIEASEGA